jgi:hypothetical protein
VVLYFKRYIIWGVFWGVTLLIFPVQASSESFDETRWSFSVIQEVSNNHSIIRSQDTTRPIQPTHQRWLPRLLGWMGILGMGLSSGSVSAYPAQSPAHVLTCAESLLALNHNNKCEDTASVSSISEAQDYSFLLRKSQTVSPVGWMSPKSINTLEEDYEESSFDVSLLQTGVSLSSREINDYLSEREGIGTDRLELLKDLYKESSSGDRGSITTWIKVNMSDRLDEWSLWKKRLKRRHRHSGNKKRILETDVLSATERPSKRGKGIADCVQEVIERSTEPTQKESPNRGTDSVFARSSISYKNFLDKTLTHPTSDKVYGYWVPSLRFEYEGVSFVEHPIHDIGTICFDKHRRGDMSSSPNYIFATIRLIYHETDGKLRAQTLHMPDKDCFVSGTKSQYFLETTRAPKCVGYSDTFSDDALFIDFLHKSGFKVDKTDPFFHSKYAHSEQALAVYLYADAKRCLRSISGGASASSAIETAKEGECLFQRELERFKIDPCLVKVFNLNIVSIPNTVCVNCARVLYEAKFVEKYNDYLQTKCDASPGMISFVQGSSLSPFMGFGGVSCAVSSHPQVWWEEIYSNKENQGLMAFKFPLDSMTDTGETIQTRCEKKLSKG